jgi:hypothetical protein
MSMITTDEIGRLNALFGDMVKEAMEIKRKAPGVKDACEQIAKYGQTAFELLREIQQR